MKVLAVVLALTSSAIALPILVRRGNVVPATNDAYIEYYTYMDYGTYQFPGYGDYPSYAPPDSKPPPTRENATDVDKVESGVKE